MYKSVILGTFFIIMMSCGEKKTFETYIYFDSAQPVKEKDLSSIPNKYVGTYVLNYSNQLMVQSKAIIRRHVEENMFTKSELDSLTAYFQLKDDKLYDVYEKKFHKTRISHDTVFFERESLDTLFSFKPNESLREFKSSLVLNYSYDGLYRVNWVHFGKPVTRITELGSIKDFEKIKLETDLKNDNYQMNADSTYVILKFDQANFRKIHRLDGFEYESFYYFK